LISSRIADAVIEGRGSLEKAEETPEAPTAPPPESEMAPAQAGS